MDGVFVSRYAYCLNQDFQDYSYSVGIRNPENLLILKILVQTIAKILYIHSFTLLQCT